MVMVGDVAHFLPWSAAAGAKCWNTSACFSRKASRFFPRSPCSRASRRQQPGIVQSRPRASEAWSQHADSSVIRSGAAVLARHEGDIIHRITPCAQHAGWSSAATFAQVAAALRGLSGC